MSICSTSILFPRIDSILLLTLIFEFLKSCEAKIYGISAWTEGYKLTKDISKLIRSIHPDATIIVGGFLALTDKALIEHTEVDVAVTTADGHLVLPEILDTLENGRDFINHSSPRLPLFERRGG